MFQNNQYLLVSTHSRLKAAGKSPRRIRKKVVCFNTQPPEGGWVAQVPKPARGRGFNTQPPEGGWATVTKVRIMLIVSTHSRLKAAGFCDFFQRCALACFNTQPPEGGWLPLRSSKRRILCFNTQPPEGGWSSQWHFYPLFSVSTHSRLKAAGFKL